MTIKNAFIGASMSPVLLGLAVKLAGAQALTPPAMDSDVQAETVNAITGFQLAALTNLGTLIPVAAVLLISVAVVYFIIKHFRAMTHA